MPILKKMSHRDYTWPTAGPSGPVGLGKSTLWKRLTTSHLRRKKPEGQAEKQPVKPPSLLGEKIVKGPQKKRKKGAQEKTPRGDFADYRLNDSVAGEEASFKKHAQEKKKVTKIRKGHSKTEGVTALTLITPKNSCREILLNTFLGRETDQEKKGG